MIQSSPAPRIVYIAGTGRSGSTLLDVILSNHQATFGTGELGTFFMEWARGGRCTCGELYPECEFWSEVIRKMLIAFPDLTPQTGELISRRVESSSGPWPAPFRRHADDRQRYAALWGTIMRAISDISGKQIIVDSSKSSRPASRRVSALSKWAGFELFVIHLVRDPRALMWSAMRGSNRLLEANKKGTFKGGVVRALITWNMTHASVHLNRLTNARLIRIRYEDFTANPVETLTKLGDFLALDMNAVIECLSNQQPFASGHGIGGNRMRRQGPVHIKVDEEWKTALPKYARILASLSWPLASRYGYDVL